MAVYFAGIKSPGRRGPIKIGMSTQPQRRINEIARLLPWRLETLAIFDDWGRKEERALMIKFEHLRLTGEWFRCHRSILEFIKDPIRPNLELPAKPVNPLIHEISDYLRSNGMSKASFGVMCGDRFLFWHLLRGSSVTQDRKKIIRQIIRDGSADRAISNHPA